MKGRFLIYLTALALLPPACGDGGTGAPDERAPVAGTVLMTLSAPNTDVGAVSIMVTGLGLQTAQPSTPTYRVFQKNLGDRLTLIVVGDIVPGRLVSIGVSDINNPVTATVLDVARRTNEQVSPLGYSVGLRVQAGP